MFFVVLKVILKSTIIYVHSLAKNCRPCRKANWSIQVIYGHWTGRLKCFLFWHYGNWSFQVFSLLQLGYFECQIPIYDNVMHLNPMRPMIIWCDSAGLPHLTFIIECLCPWPNMINYDKTRLNIQSTLIKLIDSGRFHLAMNQTIHCHLTLQDNTFHGD